MGSGTVEPNFSDQRDVRIVPISAEQTVKLRHCVLWPDHPVSHVLLPEDDTGKHYGAFIGSHDDPVAVISLFYEPLPKTSPDDGILPAMRFRKFACAVSEQGKGIGTALLSHVIAIGSSDPTVTSIWCDARLASAEWYQRRGMEPFGETFFKGPIEYVRMKIDV
ncbi:hypothetical protein PUNSTDRAFT_110806 [Punctularia strigosozonata HHB-11173 SS5]|uniref:uncharacterized protein n=1 Tax=Punctularia strigosozonata (strain HHB-11173) TaxID=741275 RepID=UPI0004416B59|nr:uncharacterized protein PUNSTDRAFT_110806 [Punctularia strigosozonata HHB-11173 SS5]EIN12202.1 hypothetical protein PUNSTDRAFT_110806 [Punctularia strigosozonata HHB-11173 SS5]